MQSNRTKSPNNVTRGENNKPQLVKNQQRSKSPKLGKPVSTNRRKAALPTRPYTKSKSPTKQRAINRTKPSDNSPPRKNETKEQKGIADLSPETVNKYERQNRPSFKGLSIIEDGHRKNKLPSSTNDAVDDEKRKEERRKQSLSMMRSSAQSDKIKTILENTLEDVNAMAVEGTGEQRLQAVMTRAKEQGMSTESIFHFFSDGNPNTTSITHQMFLEALQNLSNTYLVISDDEFINLVGKFDKNNDGSISIAEFKNYCYTEINSVAWKAERSRVESSGEMKKLKAEVSRRFTSSYTLEHSCGEDVYHTSKFFWRKNDNVDIKLYFCASLDVITMQLYSQTNEKELPSIYICKHKVDDQLLNDEMSGNKNQEQTELKEESKKEPMWEDIAKYLVARLKFKECQGEISEEGTEEESIPKLECSHMSTEANCIPFLCKLTGDTFDTLMIQKPFNLKCPPPMSSSIDDFEEVVASFQRASRNARTSRKSAQELNSLASSALNEALTEVQEMIREEDDENDT